MKLFKVLFGVFLVLFTISVPNVSSAENWVKLGFLTNRPTDSMKVDSFRKNWVYDRDSLYVDKANNIIEVTIKGKDSFVIGEDYSVSRLRLHFNPDPKQCYFTVLYEDAYDNNNRHLRHANLSANVNSIAPDFISYTIFHCKKQDFSKVRSEFYMPYVFWKEFGYYLDLPNQDGTPYLTPEEFDLTWATSNDSYGLYYFPKTLSVKDNRVYVVFAIINPHENRFQFIDGIIDYNHNVVYAYASIVKRISSGDNKYEPYKAPKGKMSSPLNINEYGDLQIAADYFRKYL